MHDASLAEVLAKFPAQNLQRQQLNDALKVVVERLWQLDSTLTILVDGSYATVKAEPNDVDLLLISARYNELSVQQYLDQVCPVEAISMHFYVGRSSQVRCWISSPRRGAGPRKGSSDSSVSSGLSGNAPICGGRGE